jgi:sulfonate transport system substrate-binding protein
MSLDLKRRALFGLIPAVAMAPRTAGAVGRDRNTVRLTWGFSGLPLIAKERGEFAKTLAKDDIRIQWIGPFPNHAPTIQAVVGDSADFSFGGSTTPALAAIIAGSPLVFSLFAVIVPRTTAIIVRGDSAIKTVSDLAGKSVAVNRSGLGEFLLVAALEKYNVDRKTVRFVYLNPPEAAPAFGSGQVDAWSMWSPQVDIARSQYNSRDIFLEGRDLDFQIDFNSWLIRGDFADKNPDLVRAVNAAFAAEADWASTHTIEAETIAQSQGRYSNEIRDAFIARKRHYQIHATTDQSFLHELQRAADWLSKRTVLPQPITVADHVTGY